MTLKRISPQTITVNSNEPALRINQTGSGNVFVAEDSANPDSSPFIIDTNGNVGVGTSIPNGRLAVKVSSGYSAGEVWSSRTLTVTTGDTNSSGAVGIAYDDTNGASIASIVPGVAWKPLTISANVISFAPDATERMRINNSGNVGIGTNSPTVRLHVVSDNEFSTGGRFVTSSAQTTLLNYPVFILENTNVAANTGASLRWSLADTGGTSRTTAQISAFASSKGATTVAGNMSFQLNDGNNNIAEHMRITSAGNVGIGTSSPSQKFHVFSSGQGNIDAARFISDAPAPASFAKTSIRLEKGVNYGGEVAGYLHQNVGSGLIFGIYNGSATPTERMRITSAGYIGVSNTSPTAWLSVPASTTAAASLNIPHGTAPTAPVNGDLWTQTDGVYARINGATFGPLGGGAGSLPTQTGNGGRFLSTDGTTPSWNANITSSGSNIGIGLSNPSYKLEVNGSFAATTKSFVIDHPTKTDMKLRYGSLEGPENGVYVRGTSNSSEIFLPDYWTELVDSDSITVQLTSKGKHQNLYVEDIAENTVYVGGVEGEFFYFIQAERKDVEKLVVEYVG